MWDIICVVRTYGTKELWLHVRPLHAVNVRKQQQVAGGNLIQVPGVHTSCVELFGLRNNL